MSDGVVLVPGAVAELLFASGEPWGYLSVTTDRVDDVHIVIGYSEKDGTRSTTQSAFAAQHYTRHCDPGGWRGAWYRAPEKLHHQWALLASRRAATTPKVLAEQLQGWRAPPSGQFMIVLTVAVIDDRLSVVGWAVEQSVAQPLQAVVVPEQDDLTPLLQPGWPADELAELTVTVVGAGSIGSAAAEALAAYAVKHLALVDPDRLMPHNLVRHRARRRWVGRYKVNAVADTLTERFPYLDIEPLPCDVIDDADRMRPLFRRSAAVVCCADGVEARQATNHLARWAQVPLVLACVLDDGAIGEILRLRPGPRAGCLQCQREQLRQAGQLDPEPGIDLDYGTGTRHRPMTAVGADLALVGDLAAKAAIATILESRGHPDQRLPGDHAILALRPPADLAAPFDLRRAGEIRWQATGPPQPGCASCEAA